MLGRGAAEDP